MDTNVYRHIIDISIHIYSISASFRFLPFGFPAQFPVFSASIPVKNAKVKNLLNVFSMLAAFGSSSFKSANQLRIQPSTPSRDPLGMLWKKVPI